MLNFVSITTILTIGTQYPSLLLDPFLSALLVVAIEIDLDSYEMTSLSAPYVKNSKKGIMKTKTMFITKFSLEGKGAWNDGLGQDARKLSQVVKGYLIANEEGARMDWQPYTVTNCHHSVTREAGYLHCFFDGRKGTIYRFCYGPQNRYVSCGNVHLIIRLTYAFRVFEGLILCQGEL